MGVDDVRFWVFAKGFLKGFFVTIFITAIIFNKQINGSLSLMFLIMFGGLVGIFCGVSSMMIACNRSIQNARQKTRSVYAFKESLERRNRWIEDVSRDKIKRARIQELIWRKTLKEKSQNYPTLRMMINSYEQFYDQQDEDYLRTKRNPAHKAADIVKEKTALARKANDEVRKLLTIKERYEEWFPELLDIYEQELVEPPEGLTQDSAYTEAEKQDEATWFLTRSEYLKLPTAERNQMALDRYWKRRHYPKELGKMYERFVGYLYEKDGWTVEYTGIRDEKSDFGRDLICTKGSRVDVVQCKNWSHYKNVFENRIFQHFGTVFQYKLSNPKKKVRAVFYTTTILSDVARAFAKEMKLVVFENYKLDKSYPCIKCNIGATGEKIYHLPFDKLYDKVKIEPKKGEFFAKTVLEAEKAGFRRTYKWHGYNKS